MKNEEKFRIQNSEFRGERGEGRKFRIKNEELRIKENSEFRGRE